MLSSYTVEFECLTHTGHVRNNNEDDFLCAGDLLPAVHGEASRRGTVTAGERAALFGVFDGMGGEAYGEEAAYLAAKTAAGSRIGEDPAAGLTRIADSMNRAVCDWAQQEGIAATGSTAVMIAFSPAEAVVCNVGDSRAYLFRDGTLRMLSEDHVIRAPGQPKGLLSRCLGMDPDTERPVPSVRREPLRAGDLYLLCSDGLTDMLSDGDIERLLREHRRGSAQALVNAALAAGGRDNVTVLTLAVTARPLRAVLRDLIRKK